MALIDRLNARGHAGGWYACQLKAHAQRAGQTMAEAFNASIENSAAYNVPALAVKRVRSDVDGHMVEFSFSDGSRGTYRVGRHC